MAPRPRRDTGDEGGSRRPIDRALAATGDLMQRPKRKTADRKPRVDFSEPERQRGRHAPGSLSSSGFQSQVQARALPPVTSLGR